MNLNTVGMNRANKVFTHLGTWWRDWDFYSGSYNQGIH